MVVCEFRFESFNARGNDEHLDRMAALLDDLLVERWVLADAMRYPEGGGWWRICLYREFNQLTVDGARR